MRNLFYFDQTLISSELGQGISACQISGYSSHAFSRKCLETFRDGHTNRHMEHRCLMEGWMESYKNWPQYGLRWSGWYCNPAQHELCLPTSTLPDCSTNHDRAGRISGQFLFYHDHNFTKSKGNLRFRCLVPLFVSIGVCVITHGDGTASDVTICLWRHNQQAMSHEHNGKPWFSLPK